MHTVEILHVKRKLFSNHVNRKSAIFRALYMDNLTTSGIIPHVNWSTMHVMRDNSYYMREFNKIRFCK